jgi:hypothetical protein
MKREKNNVGGEGVGDAVSVLRTVSSLGPTPTDLKLVAAGTSPHADEF